MFFIRFAFYFSISYLILALPISNKPTFYHLHEMLAPLTNQLFGEIEHSTTEGLKESKKIAKKFFSNTLPENSSDKIKTKYSSTEKPKKSKVQDTHQESYTVEEKLFLEKILKKAQ